MKTVMKFPVIIAVFLIIGGLVLAVAGFAMLGGDITKLNSATPMQNTYVVEEDFENIHIDAAEADVQFVPAKNGECYVDCAEEEQVYHTVEVENNTLTIERIDNRKWYEHIGIFVFESMKVTVYLPKSEYDKLYISTSSGEIDISEQYSFNDAEVYDTSGDITFSAAVKNELTAKTVSGDLSLRNIKSDRVTAQSTSGVVTLDSIEATTSMTVEATSGDLSLRDVTCGELITDNTSGDTDLTNTEAKRIESSSVSGDIKLEHCDGETLKFNTTSGSVNGSLNSDKIFTTDSTSGSINVPESVTGGTCEITTVSGDIRITIDD